MAHIKKSMSKARRSRSQRSRRKSQKRYRSIRLNGGGVKEDVDDRLRKVQQRKPQIYRKIVLNGKLNVLALRDVLREHEISIPVMNLVEALDALLNHFYVIDLDDDDDEDEERGAGVYGQGAVVASNSAGASSSISPSALMSKRRTIDRLNALYRYGAYYTDDASERNQHSVTNIQSLLESAITRPSFQNTTVTQLVELVFNAIADNRMDGVTRQDYNMLAPLIREVVLLAFAYYGKNPRY
jgi:hypothetical protein